MVDRSPQHNDNLQLNDPSGIYNITLPPGFQGARVVLLTVGKRAYDVTVTADGTDQIRGVDGSVGASWQYSMIREAVTLIFDAASAQWYLQSDGGDLIETLYDAAATVLNDVSYTQIPLTYRGGDDELFKAVGGDIQASYALIGRSVSLDSVIGCDLDALGNNTGVSVVLRWRLVSGTGLVLLVPDTASTGIASRPWSINPLVSPGGLWAPAASDLLRLEGIIIDSEGANSAATIASYASVEVK